MAPCRLLFTLWITTATWDFVLGLMERNLWLGRVAIGAGAAIGADAIAEDNGGDLF